MGNEFGAYERASRRAGAKETDALAHLSETAGARGPWGQGLKCASGLHRQWSKPGSPAIAVSPPPVGSGLNLWDRRSGFRLRRQCAGGVRNATEPVGVGSIRPVL